MPAQRLKEFLDSNQVRYVVITHSTAFTTSEVAQSAHIRGKDMAKTVMVKVDGRMAMAVLPATHNVDFGLFKFASGSDDIVLATEAEFRDLFPGCEVGAMPPFGNLYDMDVYISERLADDEEIAFNAGTHREGVKLAYKDFMRLVQPKIMRLA